MLSKKLLEMKERANMTNQQIADKSRVPLGTVNRILSGHTDNPSFQSVADMVQAMGGDMKDLLELIPKESEVISVLNIPGVSDMVTEKTETSKIIEMYEQRISDQRKWLKLLFTCYLSTVAVLVLVVILEILK